MLASICKSRQVWDGFTTIELRCNETGELKFMEEFGDQR